MVNARHLDQRTFIPSWNRSPGGTRLSLLSLTLSMLTGVRGYHTIALVMDMFTQDPGILPKRSIPKISHLRHFYPRQFRPPVSALVVGHQICGKICPHFGSDFATNHSCPHMRYDIENSLICPHYLIILSKLSPVSLTA